MKESVKKGQKLGGAIVEFRRPGFGISPDVYESLVEHRFLADLPAGHMVRLEDIINEAS